MTVEQHLVYVMINIILTAIDDILIEYGCIYFLASNRKQLWLYWKDGRAHSTHWGRSKMVDIAQTAFSNVWISIKISLSFVPKGLIINIPVLVQIIAWRRPGDKLLSELMVVSLLTHIFVSRPQWLKRSWSVFWPMKYKSFHKCDEYKQLWRVSYWIRTHFITLMD